MVIQIFNYKIFSKVQMQNCLTWKPASKYIELVFEEGGIRPLTQEDIDEENEENCSSRKNQKHPQEDSDEIEFSYEPSHEIIDFEKSGEESEVLDISISGKVIIDEIPQALVFSNKSMLPKLTVKRLVPKTEDKEVSKNKFIELMLAQKSQNSEIEKYKIIKGGIKGTTRIKNNEEFNIKFEKNKFNHVSNPEKSSRFLIAFYEQTNGERNYKSIMVSDEISIIEDHKILIIENSYQLRLYFEPIQISFLQKTGHQVQKISTLNKYKVAEELGTFQNYLIKKNKKIWNIVYAAYKYSHIIDLYFLNSEVKSKKDQFVELWKQALGNAEVDESLQIEKTCNHLHPQAKFVLKINSNLRNVRFFIRKDLTQVISILSSDGEFANAENKWTKFDSINDLKDAYIICQAEVQAKMINDPLPSRTSVVNSSHPIVESKKNQVHALKHDDDFNEDDEEEDDGEYEGESSEIYSVSNRKRSGRIGQKKNERKNDSNLGRITRNRNKNKDDTDEEHPDKRGIMNKKLKEKESSIRANISQSQIGNMPFRVLNPAQAAQHKDQQILSDGKIAGMINMNGVMMPMPMNASMMQMGSMKKPDDKSGNQPNSSGSKPAMGMGMPMMVPAGGNPQMMMQMMMANGGSMPAGAQMVPMGNGMQAIMIPVQMDKNGQAIGQFPMMGGMPMMNGGGIPPGFMMPVMPGDKNMMQNPRASEGEKKQTAQGEKKDEQKQSFPPQNMDMSKMGYQMPMMPGMMSGGGMPQFMQMGGMNGMGGMVGMGGMGGQMPQMSMMGMPAGMNGMSMGSNGVPIGMMMNPMMVNQMQMQKPSSENKEEANGKTQKPQAQMPSMPSNGMFGGMPYMINQMGQPVQGSSQAQNLNSGMQMGMFPSMQQMGQAGMLSQMPGMAPMMSQQSMLQMQQMQQMMRNMTPQQQQQMMMQMKGGMMPSIYQMPKNDNNPKK